MHNYTHRPLRGKDYGAAPETASYPEGDPRAKLAETVKLAREAGNLRRRPKSSA